MGDIIREIPALEWAGRGAVQATQSPEPPLLLLEAVLFPYPTPLPNSSGRDGPRPSAWLDASSLRNVVVGAGD